MSRNEYRIVRKYRSRAIPASAEDRHLLTEMYKTGYLRSTLGGDDFSRIYYVTEKGKSAATALEFAVIGLAVAVIGAVAGIIAA